MSEENLSWVPVIAALCGGSIGLLGALGSAWFNQRTSERLAKEDRQRKRLEEVYTTLFAIKSNYCELSAKISSKILEGIDIRENSFPEISPILKLEMLIDLYFPELKNVHDDFVNAKSTFGTEYAAIISTNYKDKSTGDKQIAVIRTYELLTIIYEKTTTIQSRVSKIIKS